MKKTVLFSLFAAFIILAGINTGFAYQTGTLIINEQDMLEWGGEPVGPMSGTFNGVSGSFVCDDFSDYIYPKTSYTMTKTNMNDLSTVKFKNQTDYVQKYKEAAWLLSRMYDTPNTDKTGAIQFAIWQIFEPRTDINYGLNATRQTAVTNWINLAAGTDYTNFDFSGFYIYTPVSGDRCHSSDTQELLSWKPGTDTPEVPVPSTMLLLVPGLVGLVALRRTNKK